jgi:hypothetical protein
LSDNSDIKGLTNLFRLKAIVVNKNFITSKRKNILWTGVQFDTIQINVKKIKTLQPVISHVVYPEYSIKNKKSNFFIFEFDTLYQESNNNKMGSFFDNEIVHIKNRKKIIFKNTNKTLRLNHCLSCIEDSNFCLRFLKE